MEKTKEKQLEFDFMKEKEGKLETILGLATGLGLATYHQIQMYNLMEKAGMYETNEIGQYIKASEWPIWTISTACLSLLFGGMYIGRKVGKFIKNR